jgi:hypothetical protein
MKTRFLIISTTVIITTVAIFVVEFFLFGYNTKSDKLMSLDSPDGVYNAYVIENPALDPPNQSIFISKNGLNEFRLVEDLPEDIDAIKNILWSPDGKTVVFATNWYLIITEITNFNTKKISLNPDWWKWHDKKGTFSSSSRDIVIKEIEFCDSDSLIYMTNEMTNPEKICIVNL